MNDDLLVKEDPLSALLVEPIMPSQDLDLNGSRNENLECDEFELEMIFGLVWDTDGNEMRRAGLSEENIFLLSSPENAKSRKIYKNHQKKYIAYAIASSSDMYKEETMINYFVSNYENGTYSVGSFWQMFSCTLQSHK